jgi:hypothetical protein
MEFWRGTATNSTTVSILSVGILWHALPMDVVVVSVPRLDGLHHSYDLAAWSYSPYSIESANRNFVLASELHFPGYSLLVIVVYASEDLPLTATPGALQGALTVEPE